MTMRNVAKLIIPIIILTVAGIWLLGCGSSDLLDENDLRYAATMTIEDAGEETMTVDVVQEFDCNDDGNYTDPEEYTDTFANITVTVASGAPGITLESYRLEYIPLASSDGTGGAAQLPPELVEPEDGHSTFSIASGGKVTFTITLLSTATKQEYRDEVGWVYLGNDLWAAPALDPGRYAIRVTMYFMDEYSVEREIVVERTVYLGGYDRC